MHGSIGIATYPAHGSGGQELLQKADVAMYLAKGDRSGFAVYPPERDRNTEQRLTLTTALRRGLDQQQFVLDYQPIIQLRTGAVVGVEALLRWDHPEQGRLLPREFIQVAERSGLITPLTAFAIDRALSDWPRTAPAGARHDCRQPVAAQPARPVARRAHPPHARAAPREPLDAGARDHREPDHVGPRRVHALPQGAARMGVRSIVDDFGTGYSSLSYLRRLPVDQLKIDQSFVIGLAAGEDDTLVRSIIDLAHNLGLTVVAEGVETAEVSQRLLTLGCDLAQGHYISRPGPAASIAEFIAQQNRVDMV